MVDKGWEFWAEGRSKEQQRLVLMAMGLLVLTIAISASFILQPNEDVSSLPENSPNLNGWCISNIVMVLITAVLHGFTFFHRKYKNFIQGINLLAVSYLSCLSSSDGKLLDDLYDIGLFVLFFSVVALALYLLLCTLRGHVCLVTLTGHTDDVNCVAELSDGRIISGSRDQTLKIWDSSSGACVATLAGTSALLHASPSCQTAPSFPARETEPSRFGTP